MKKPTNYKTPPIRYTGVGYLTEVRRQEQITEVVKQLVVRIQEWEEEPGNHFDFIAFTGVSGMLVGPMVACKLERPFTVVRKTTDRTHAGRTHTIEGWAGGGRFIIIDDLVDTGKTVHTMWTTLCRAAKRNPKEWCNRSGKWEEGRPNAKPVPVAIFTYGVNIRHDVDLYIKAGKKTRLEHRVTVYES